MVAKFARLKNLGEVLERGLVVFNDATQSFEPLVRSGVEFLPCSDSGHAFSVDAEGRKYYYFATPFPMAVRMRVRAQWDDVVDANRYEILTALEPKKPAGRRAPRLNLGEPETPYRWVRFGQLTGGDASAKNSVIEALKGETKDVSLCNMESGKDVSPHGGTVYFNAYRQRWVAVFVQQFGENSFLGDLWYAEADTPVGPWAYARKIATHKKPRYDYNQLMYRLNLDDPRLALPVAVYHTRDKQDARNYLLRDGVEEAGMWDSVESIPFYAVEPERAFSDLVPLYAQNVPGGNKETICLIVKRPDPSAAPLFYALPPSGPPDENPCVVSLYEYRHADTAQRLYSTNPQLHKKDWIRTDNPLCRVWKTPPAPLLLDSKAKPTGEH
jgi:hypothetical protein